jgi:transcriptional regulator with XRE-family HTH domain
MSQADFRELLLRKGRTQRQCGVDQSYANQLAGGTRQPRANALRKIAEAIGCTTEEVLAACQESIRRAHSTDLAAVGSPAGERTAEASGESGGDESDAHVPILPGGCP